MVKSRCYVRRHVAPPAPAGATPVPRGRAVRAQFLGILVSRGLGSGLQALALIVLARSVPAASFGAVTAVIALVGFLLVVTGFGMAAFVPRARALGADDDVRAGLRLNWLSTAVTTPVLLAVTGWWAVEHHAPLAVALICLSLGLERNVDTVLGVPIADGDARTAATSMVLRRTVSLVVLVLGIVAGVDPVVAYTLGLLAGAVAAQVHVRLRVRDLPGNASAVPTRELARRGWPFLVANVAGQARTLDVPLVAAVLSPAAAGLYAAAVKLVQPVLLIPQSLAAVVAPRRGPARPPGGPPARGAAGRGAARRGAAAGAVHGVRRADRHVRDGAHVRGQRSGAGVDARRAAVLRRSPPCSPRCSRASHASTWSQSSAQSPLR